MSASPQLHPTITFLNSTGDVTVTWAKDKEAEMLALIEAKMKAGFTFFVLKPILGGLLGHYKAEVTDIAQVRKSGSVTAPDALGKSVALHLGDEAVSQAVAAGHATLLSTAKQATMDTVRRAATALDVVKNQTVAVRPIQGG